jgi:signal transduction histidine kinase
MTDQDFERLKRRLERERRARQEAEAIAERVTGELYATGQQLEHSNSELVRTNDELQAVNQAMRDFVAIASHDLRGPLTAIMGFAAAMTRRWDKIPEEQKLEFIATIQRQSEHLNYMIEDLLTVSKIEAGALDVHRDVVRLREAMTDAIEIFKQRSSDIQVVSPPGLTAIVDPDHLRRILVNFVGNALKYGAPPVEVEASDHSDWIEIRVRDHGSGVPEDFRTRLFSRFARSDEARASGVSGTGLGLSIVQGLAQANGGDVWYEPNEPSGSIFALRLPKNAA